MDDFLSGLVCGGVLLFLPLAALAVAAFLTARRTHAELEELRLAMTEVQRQLRAGGAPAGASSLGVRPPAVASSPAPAPSPEASPAAASTPAASAPPPAASAPPPAPPRSPAPPPAPPIELGKLIERGAIWAFAGLGGLLLVIAVLFGLREAIAAGWFGPVARFAGAVFVGLGAWFVGELLHWRKYETPAAALSGAGAAILYAALFAAHSRWGLMSATPAFVCMAGVSAVAMFLAERRSSRFVALLAMAGGYATPILLSSGENRAVAFFSYLTVLNAGLLVVARRRRWPEFVFGSGLVTLLLYLGWTVAYRAPDQVPVGLAAAGVFTTLFLLAARGMGSGWQEQARAISGVGAALLMWLCGTLAFGTPTDPARHDPASYAPLSWDLGSTAWMGAAWLLVGVVALPLITRKSLPVRLASSAAVGLGAFVFLVSWALAGEGRWEVVVPTAIALSFVGWFSGAGRGGAVITLAVLGAVGFAALVEPVPAGLLAPLIGGLTVSVMLAAWREGTRLPLLAMATLGVVPLYGGLLSRVDDGEAGPLALAVMCVYVATAVFPLLRARPGDLAGAATSAVAPITLAYPLYLLWHVALGTDVDGLLPLVLGVNTLLGALVLVRASAKARFEREVALLVAVTLTGVAVAVPLQLDRAWLTVGWALLVALLGLVHRRLRHPLFVAFATALALAVSARLLLNPYALGYGRGDGPFIFNWTLYTWGIPTVCLLLAARWFDVGWLKVGLRTAAVLTGFALVNLEVAHAFARDHELSFRSEQLGQEMVRSISWGAYGLMLIILGIRNRSRAVRLGGLAFAVAAAGKVFAVDMWSLDGFARVGAFGGLAITLLAAAVAFAWLARSDDAAEKSKSETKP